MKPVGTSSSVSYSTTGNWPVESTSYTSIPKELRAGKRGALRAREQKRSQHTCRTHVPIRNGHSDPGSYTHLTLPTN